MARTKNTARHNPFVLPRAVLAGHLQAIAVSTEVESDLEIRDMGSNLSTMVDAPEIANNVDTVAFSKMFQKRVSQSPGHLHKGTSTPSVP